MQDKLLEVTVWDYDRVAASQFLGEVLVDLTTANLNDEAYWYQLNHHDNGSIPLPSTSPRSVSCVIDNDEDDDKIYFWLPRYKYVLETVFFTFKQIEKEK